MPVLRYQEKQRPCRPRGAGRPEARHRPVSETEPQDPEWRSALEPFRSVSFTAPVLYWLKSSQPTGRLESDGYEIDPDRLGDRGRGSTSPWESCCRTRPNRNERPAKAPNTCAKPAANASTTTPKAQYRSGQSQHRPRGEIGSQQEEERLQIQPGHWIRSLSCHGSPDGHDRGRTPGA